MICPNVPQSLVALFLAQRGATANQNMEHS